MVESKARLQARNGIRVQRGTKLGTGADRRRPARVVWHGGSSVGGRSGTRNHCGENRVDGPRHVSCPHALRTRLSRENDTGVIREDQPKVGAISHRTKCPRKKRERERPGDSDHALRRSAPLWLFSIREFWTSTTAGLLRRIPQVHGDG